MSLNYQAAVNINAQFTGQRAIDQAKKGLSDLGGTANGLPGVLGKATTALKAFAGAYAVKETVAYFKSLIDLGDEFNDLRQKTGIGVQALSNLKTAAELNGVEFGQLEGSLKKFNVNVANAAAGSDSASLGFRALGVSLKDSNGNLKSSDKLLFDVADKFAGMEDGAGKAALAVKLFGKSGADLIPLLNQGSQELQRFGLVMSTEFTQGADKLNDSLSLIGLNFKQAGIDGLAGLLPALNQISEALVDFTKDMFDLGDSTELVSDVLKGLTLTVAALAQAFITGADVIVTAFRGAYADLNALADAIADRFQTLGEQISVGITGGFEEVGRLEDEYEKRKAARAQKNAEEIEAIDAGLVQRTEKRLEKLKNLYSDLYEKQPEKIRVDIPARRSSAPALPDDAEASKRADQLKREDEAIQKLIADKNELIALNELERQRLSLSTEEYKKREAAIKGTADAEKATLNFSEQNKQRYMEITEQIVAQKQALIALQEEQKKSYGAGAQAAIKEYVENATDSAKQTKDVFNAAFRGLEDALVNFVKTGKLSFQDLASTISDMLIRIAIQKSIAFAFQSAGFGFADGGIMTGDGPVPLKKYANGGVARSPQLALFGEGSMPEAYVPLPDGRNIPVKMQGPAVGGGGDTSVVVNVNMGGGSVEGEDNTSNTDKGRELGRLISTAVKNEILTQKRPGGLLAAGA